MPTQPPDLARLLIVGANHRSGSVGLISTCDRVECFAVCDDMPAAREKLRVYFTDRAGGDTDTALYHYEGEQAVSHLFRVASSLDSQIVGEPQVLGQVKTAHW